MLQCVNISNLLCPPSLFFFGENSWKPSGNSGHGTSPLFCLCVNFPFHASSCLLSQQFASSLTHSQKTKSPGLGESNKSLNSLLYLCMTLFVRWCLSQKVRIICFEKNCYVYVGPRMGNGPVYIMDVPTSILGRAVPLWMLGPVNYGFHLYGDRDLPTFLDW